MTTSSRPLVGIVMGSESDLPIMEEAGKALKELGVPYTMTIASAHRAPDLLRSWIRSMEAQGVRVIIAGAGGAAHLAGVTASETLLPVIGVPLEASSLQGLDALLSTVQMPGGIPVATVAIGKAGAKNAGILAARILALQDDGLAKRLGEYRAKMAQDVEKKAKSLAERLMSNPA
ncbi:MAG TPA: 5-(carboxyamino)imidazole ribonucleotide mutase [Nitrospiria bacterium]|nr:5-(carboxyamino)imidazole ribonucleotide mutase [Nitrospiria bacterium]